jgi:hypothetical protein
LSSGFLGVEVYSYWFSPPMLKINLWDVWENLQNRHR